MQIQIDHLTNMVNKICFLKIKKSNMKVKQNIIQIEFIIQTTITSIQMIHKNLKNENLT